MHTTSELIGTRKDMKKLGLAVVAAVSAFAIQGVGVSGTMGPPYQNGPSQTQCETGGPWAPVQSVIGSGRCVKSAESKARKGILRAQAHAISPQDGNAPGYQWAFASSSVRGRAHTDGGRAVTITVTLRVREALAERPPSPLQTAMNVQEGPSNVRSGSRLVLEASVVKAGCRCQATRGIAIASTMGGTESLKKEDVVLRFKLRDADNKRITAGWVDFSVFVEATAEIGDLDHQLIPGPITPDTGTATARIEAVVRKVTID